MKKKIEMLKSLFLAISRSSVINWAILLVLIIGLIFDLFGLLFYKTIALFVCLEVMFLNANTYKIRFVEEEEKK